jgi:MFS family permease
MSNNKTLISLNLAVFMMMLGVGMIMALLPQRIIDLTGSGATVGYLAAAFAISYILLQVPIGNLSDRWGFKFFLVSGYVLCAIAGGLYYFANRPHWYFIGRILQGAGEAPVWALAPALLSIKYAESKGKVIGIYNASIHVGLTLGPILGILLGQTLTGNQPFIFYALACLTGALIILLLIKNIKSEGLSKQQTLHFRSILTLLTTGQSLTALIGIALYGAGYGMFLTTIPAFLIRFKGFNQLWVSLFFTLFYVAISISQLITGGLSDKFGRKPFMTLGLMIAAIGCATFPGLSQPWISIVLTVSSLGLGVFYLSSMAHLNEIVPNSLKGTITGAYYLFWGIGFFFGPILIGKLSESNHSGLGYRLFGSILMIESLALAFGIINKKPSTGKNYLK